MYAPSSVAQAAIPNPDQITQTLAKLEPDAALQQYASMHKNDPYIISLAVAEANRRKALRAQPMQQQPTVVDQNIATMAPAPAHVPQQMPPQQMAQQQRLPEQQGIGALPARNIENMADGGIAGYADDEGPGYAGGTAVNSAFEDAVGFTLGHEGGYTLNDAGRGETNFGINKTANPDVDIKKLTKEKAKQLYKERYWDAIGGDKLAAHNPALAKVAFDTAVNMGPKTALQMVNAAKGDPAKMLELRGQKYEALIKDDPERFAPAAPAWKSRMDALTSAIIPSAQAATPAQAAPAAGGDGIADIVRRKETIGQIPGGTIREAQPEVPLTGDEMLTGIGETGLQYLTGLAAIPTAGAYAQYRKARYGDDAEKVFAENAGAVTYSPRTAGGKAVSERVGSALEDLKIPPIIAGAGTASPRRTVARAATSDLEGIAAARRAAADAQMQTATTPRLEPPVTKQPVMSVDSQGRIMSADSRARVGAAFADREAALKAGTEADAWQKAANESRQLPAQDAKLKLRADAEAEAEAQAARERTSSQVVSAGAGTIPSSFAAQETQAAQAAPNAGMSIADQYAEYGRGRQFAQNADMPPEIKKEAVEAAKEEIPKSERKGFGYEDLMMFGLQLLASKSPYFGQAVGEAGVGAIGAKMAREKGETERIKEGAMADYYKEHGAYLKSEAARRAEEDKPLAQARKEIAAELLKLQSNTLYQMAPPAERQAMERSARQAIMGQYPELAGTLGGAFSASSMSPAETQLVNKYLR